MSEDQLGALIAGVVLSLAGVVIYAVTKGAAAGRVEANSAVGLRTRSTMASAQAWRTAHQAALPLISITAGLTIASGLGAAVLGTLAPDAAAVLVLVSAGSLVVGTIAGGMRGHIAAKRLSANPRDAASP